MSQGIRGAVLQRGEHAFPKASFQPPADIVAMIAGDCHEEPVKPMAVLTAAIRQSVASSAKEFLATKASVEYRCPAPARRANEPPARAAEEWSGPVECHDGGDNMCRLAPVGPIREDDRRSRPSAVGDPHADRCGRNSGAGAMPSVNEVALLREPRVIPRKPTHIKRQ